jgi:hypothetical protein
MDNHPIPQDITGFEFKLIGNMTVKQFAYIAAGVFFGWVLFVTPLLFVIKVPLALISVGIGVALAFIPIEGRPMDVMVKNFFKAVFSPTQYIYRKVGGTLSIQSSQVAVVKSDNSKNAAQKQLKDFLNALPIPKNKLDKKETIFFESLNEYGANKPLQQVPGFVPTHVFSNKAQPIQQPSLPSAPSKNQPPPQIDESQDALQKSAALLEKELKEAQAKEAQAPQQNSEDYLKAHQKVLELQKNLNDLLSQKQELETKLIDLQREMASQGKSVFTPSIAQPEALKETKFVRSIPQSMQKGAGLPIAPEFPNVITGIIKDPRGNPLSNILVEVKDSQGNAVRAFKTNALGQFASATPLINGEYTIAFEDPKNQNKFDTVAFKANGEVILPIEIISVDAREELRRSLFN